MVYDKWLLFDKIFLKIKIDLRKEWGKEVNWNLSHFLIMSSTPT